MEKLENNGIGWQIKKEQDGKSFLAENQPIESIGDTYTVIIWWLHTNPSKIHLDRNVYNPGRL